jgi:hypothetical protein
MPNDGHGEEVTRWELLKFFLRHPLKAVGVLFVAALGMAVAEVVEWEIKSAGWEIQVRSGRSAESHQIAEGINA